MSILNFFHLFLLSLALGQQILFPVSNCLGNCQGCYLQDPTACVNQINNSTGQKTRCIAFYDGPNCTTGGSYYNLYAENGVLNNFANWSLPSQPQRQVCEPLQGGNNITGIGPFSANLNATKVLQFSPSQAVRRLVIKIGVGVSDARLLQLQSNFSQTVEYVEINGTLYIVTTSRTSNQSQSTQTIPFLSLQVRNILNGNQLISTLSTAYQTPSRIQTKCGFVYQYQFEVQASAGTLFQQLLLNLYLPTGSSTLWWLFDFRVEAGCSGFSVGSGCSNCLTGFYQALTAEGYSNGCKPCHMACGTCSSASICLSCQKYATYDSTTQKCSYPKNYAVYNKSDSFQATAGTRVNGSSILFSSIYRSQNRQLTLGFNLKNNQSYFLKLYFLYPQSFIDSSVTFALEVDGQSWQAANLNANSPTLSSLNSGTQQLFLIPFTLDKMGNNVQASSSLSVRTLPSALAQEFYVVDPTIIQYQCSQNCLQCSFSLTQSTQCKRCLPFYRTDINCLSCANGFFPIAQVQNSRCVKCYSNCKQCRGPSRYDCTECFDQFGLTDVAYDSNCLKMIQSLFRNGTQSGYCPSAPTRDAIAANSNCSACLNQPSYSVTSSECVGCWLAFGYVWGRCGPLPTSGLSLYATQSSVSWTGNGITGYNCSSDYLNIYGVPNIANNLNHITSVPSTITTTFNNLPSHFGLRFAINIFKVDYWAVASPSNISFPLSVTLVVSAPNTQNTSFSVQLDNNIGANICGQVSRDMIWALSGGVTDHQASSVTFSVLAPDKGVFVRELQIYLSNCQTCSSVGLSFSLFFLPAYADNDTQTGTDVFVTFNRPLLFKNSTQSFGSQSFLNSFTFKIDSNPVYSIVKDDFLADPKKPYAKYFVPLKQSYTNATVTATTNQPDLVYAASDGSNRQLVTSSQSASLQRYSDASLDTRKSMSQLSDLFTFFTWFVLITMIVSVGLGVGVVIQQFSQILQIIFLHIYITSWLLPPTVKVPLSHASRMEHLNYFSNISTIEESLFGLKPLIQSNYIFQQYNIDVYFLRSLYPILIINAIFIGWFIILKLIERFATGFRNSPNKLARFLRSISNRPLAYFDQIWRYQFLAVMWACMVQFTSFEGNKLNLAICVLAFIVGTLWPLIVTIYTYRKHFTTNVKHFLYLYHDLFYLKTSSLCNEPKSYMYVGMRAMRLLAYAIFIALFVNQSIVGPVILIFFNLIQGSVAFFLDIYRSALYLLTRIIQNILLIVAAILCMVIYGFADRQTFGELNYEDVGYGLATVFVLLIINGIVRFLYLVYKKVNEWSIGTYDVGERGQLQNFDDRSPVKVPQSERLD